MMASLRKIRIIASREKEKNKIKCRERSEKQRVTKFKMAQKEFRKGIKEALGFDKYKFIKKPFSNPSTQDEWDNYWEEYILKKK